MPHRDPQTGQFVSDGASHSFDDIEIATFAANVGVEASNMTGTTSFTGEIDEFEGLELLDLDEFVDRNEDLTLLEVQHRMVVWTNSTATEDGTISAAAEISADPALADTTRRAAIASHDDFGEDPVGGVANQNDSIDLIGRPLAAVGTQAFSDTTNGQGGGGAPGHDVVQTTTFPGEYGMFHPRDELFLNGRFSTTNVADAGIHMSISGQHVYGVTSR